jgi:hypothetical protein
MTPCWVRRLRFGKPSDFPLLFSIRFCSIITEKPVFVQGLQFTKPAEDKIRAGSGITGFRGGHVSLQSFILFPCQPE